VPPVGRKPIDTSLRVRRADALKVAIQNFLYQRVITISATHSFRSVKIVVPFKRNGPYLLDNVDQLINADQLGGADIQRLNIVASK